MTQEHDSTVQFTEEDDRPERHARARASDPETSHIAAQSLDDETLTFLEELIFDLAAESDTNGITLDDVVLRTGLDRNTVSPRFAPMRTARWIRAQVNSLGKRVTRPGVSNRPQIVWIVDFENPEAARRADACRSAMRDLPPTVDEYLARDDEKPLTEAGLYHLLRAFRRRPPRPEQRDAQIQTVLDTVRHWLLPP